MKVYEHFSNVKISVLKTGMSIIFKIMTLKILNAIIRKKSNSDYISGYWKLEILLFFFLQFSSTKATTLVTYTTYVIRRYMTTQHIKMNMTLRNFSHQVKFRAVFISVTLNCSVQVLLPPFMVILT